MEKSRILDIDYHGFILLTLNNEVNLVPSILGGEKYSFYYPTRDYEYDCCYLGYLDYIKSYDSFSSYQSNFLNDSLKELEDQYLKARSLEYFNSLSGLAHEFSQIKKEYDDLKKSGRKIDYDKDPANSYLNFIYVHQEIISSFDIRFCPLNYEIDYENPIDDKVGMLKLFEINPNVDYQTYIDFIDEFYIYKQKQIKQNITFEIKDFLNDFASLCSDIKNLLTNNEKVGFIYLYTSLPKRMLNKDLGKLSDLTIDLYSRLKTNIIYWVRKD